MTELAPTPHALPLEPFSQTPRISTSVEECSKKVYTIQDVRARLCPCEWSLEPDFFVYVLILDPERLGISYEPAEVRTEFVEYIDELWMRQKVKHHALEICVGDSAWLAPIPDDAVRSSKGLTRIEQENGVKFLLKREDWYAHNAVQTGLNMPGPSEWLSPANDKETPIDRETDHAFPNVYQSPKDLKPFPNHFPYAPPKETDSFSNERSSSEASEKPQAPEDAPTPSLQTVFSEMRAEYGTALATMNRIECTERVLNVCVNRSVLATPEEIRNLVRMLECANPRRTKTWARDLWTIA